MFGAYILAYKALPQLSPYMEAGAVIYWWSSVWVTEQSAVCVCADSAVHCCHCDCNLSQLLGPGLAAWTCLGTTPIVCSQAHHSPIPNSHVARKALRSTYLKKYFPQLSGCPAILSFVGSDLHFASKSFEPSPPSATFTLAPIRGCVRKNEFQTFFFYGRKHTLCLSIWVRVQSKTKLISFRICW